MNLPSNPGSLFSFCWPKFYVFLYNRQNNMHLVWLLEYLMRSKWVKVAQSCPGSLWLHGLYPTKILCPWDFPGKDTGVGSHFLLQESSQLRDPTQVSYIASRLHRLSHQGSPLNEMMDANIQCNAQYVLDLTFPCLWTPHLLFISYHPRGINNKF